MLPANTRMADNIEHEAILDGHEPSPNVFAVPSLTSAASTFSLAKERRREIERRNAISGSNDPPAQAGNAQTALKTSDDTIVSDDSPALRLAETPRLLQSDHATMVDANASPISSPGCHVDASSSAQLSSASKIRVLPQTSASLDDKLTASRGLERSIVDARVLDRKNDPWLTLDENELVMETRNARGRKTGGIVIFPTLTSSKRTEILQSEDLSRYVVESPHLPGQVEASKALSSTDKGKGKATDTLSTPSSRPTGARALRRTTAAPDSCAGKKILSSVERRAANYTVTHPPGWFDGLPPVDEELFQDSPHKEYKMVLIHTARCNVCLQYNKGTLFMCADCTVSVCEGCADRKSGVGVEEGAPRKEVEMMEATTVDEVADASTLAATKWATASADIAVEEAGDGTDRARRPLDWCGPYHEVFRGAYLEWKVAREGRDGFVSTEGVQFKPSTGKPGGRKRKAT